MHSVFVQICIYKMHVDEMFKCRNPWSSKSVPKMTIIITGIFSPDNLIRCFCLCIELFSNPLQKHFSYFFNAPLLFYFIFQRQVVYYKLTKIGCIHLKEIFIICNIVRKRLKFRCNY